MVSGSLHLAPTNSFFNDGENDLGQVPHHILLVRGLDPLTTEETLYAATNQVATLRRVLLIKDRASRMSWGFAFLDYHDIQAGSNKNFFVLFIYLFFFKKKKKQLVISYLNDRHLHMPCRFLTIHNIIREDL